jgi:hypothetical protein
MKRTTGTPVALSVFITVVCLCRVPSATREIGQAVDSSSAGPTFTKDVLPILQKHCQSCHRPGQIAPMSFLSFSEVRPWVRAIKMQITSRAMPPWFADPKHGKFLNDRSLSQSEIDTLTAWVDRDAPQGDPGDAPAPVAWPRQGWQIEPEVAVSLPDYPVPATGVVEGENLVLRSPFKEDTWLTSVEVLSSEPSVVHHICVSFQRHSPDVVYNRYEWMEVPRDAQGVAVPPAGRTSQPVQLSEKSSGEGWVLSRDAGSSEVNRRFGRPTITGAGTFCAVPGQSTRDFRQYGAAALLRADYTDIVLNVHYTSNGKALVDRTKIGFTTTRQPPRKKFVEFNASGTTSDFAIPPNASNYLAPPIDVKFRREAELVWMLPHMHMRGKDVTYTVIHPSGRRDTVLHVPRYDFRWQLGYFIEPLKLYRGSTIHVEAHYNNSRSNRNNPNPDTWVYGGLQNWEEMFSALFAVLVDRDVDETQLSESFQVLD